MLAGHTYTFVNIAVMVHFPKHVHRRNIYICEYHTCVSFAAFVLCPVLSRHRFNEGFAEGLAMSFANFQCCARHLRDPQFDPRLFGTFQEACVLLVKAAVPWGRPIYTANHNGGRELDFDASFAKVVFLHFAGATIALNQDK